MAASTHRNHILISPQIYVSLDPVETRAGDSHVAPRQATIPMTWSQFENDFRLDVDLPSLGVLDVHFSVPVGALHVNGETIWENDTPRAVGISGLHAELTPAGLRLTCTSGGSIHILAQCHLKPAATARPVDNRMPYDQEGQQ